MTLDKTSIGIAIGCLLLGGFAGYWLGGQNAMGIAGDYLQKGGYKNSSNQSDNYTGNYSGNYTNSTINKNQSGNYSGNYTNSTNKTR